MKYFYEMDNKYGFSDGEAIPEEAEHSREVYVRAINAMCEKRYSGIRAIAYNRQGLHNCCMIMRVTVEDYMKIMEKKLPKDFFIVEYDDMPQGYKEPDGDSEYNNAVSDAHDMCLDDYITIKVSVNYQKLLRTLKRKAG